MVSQVEHYLSTVGADRTTEGRFKIWGSCAVGLDEEEIVVPGNAEYEVSGRRCNLAAGLASTSYGTAVAVF